MQLIPDAWRAASNDVSTAPEHQRARERIEAALDYQLVHVWPFDDMRQADLVLDARPVGSWTLHARDGRVTFKAGRVRRPTTTVCADAATLIDVLEGERSGVTPSILFGGIGALVGEARGRAARSPCCRRAVQGGRNGDPRPYGHEDDVTSPGEPP